MSSSDVLIVGAGCFGLSTALHIQKQGNVSVTLLDRQQFPGQNSASLDSSRIIRADYPDPLYAHMGQEALVQWRSDPIFQQAFHQTGWLFAALPGDNFVLDSYELQKKLGSKGVQLMSPEDVAARYSGLTGDLTGWDIYSNPDAGWANAQEAMQSALDAFLSFGGKFVSGLAGTFTSLITDDNTSNGSKVIGIRTADNLKHYAPKVLLAVGAEVPRLVGIQMVHTLGFCIAHWRLTPAECAIWANHPIIDLHRHGYMFPPDTTGLMKMGWGINAYHNTAGPWKTTGIPVEAEAGIRKILQLLAPDIAGKQFFDTKVCWDGMSEDGNWLISPVPGKHGLFVAGGGSGHAFKFLPTIGKYVASLMDGTLPDEHKTKWKWREGSGDPQRAIAGRPIKKLAKLC